MGRVLERLESLDPEKTRKAVSLTGGEPLLQVRFLEQLVPELRRCGHKIYLETNGTLPRALERIVEGCDWIAMDLKPESAIGRDMWEAHRWFLKTGGKKIFVKMVLSGTTSEEELRRAVTLIAGVRREIPFVLQPATAWGSAKSIPLARLASWWSLASPPALRRPHSSANSPALGDSVTKNLFIAGTPGVGKTSLLREVTLSKRERIGGFYTDHMLTGRMRKGFVMRTFDGQERVLASKGMKSSHQLGKYGVDINALENVGIPALKLALMAKDMIVIDEIGSMEMMSERFRQTLLECLTSTKPVLATIRAASQPFSDQVKKFSDTQTITLTKANYNQVKLQVRKWLDSHL